VKIYNRWTRNQHAFVPQSSRRSLDGRCPLAHHCLFSAGLRYGRRQKAFTRKALLW